MDRERIEKLASLDVDAQCCFSPLCPDELPIPEGDQIVAALNAQATYARLRIGTKDAHPANALWVASVEHPQLEPMQNHGAHMDLRWNRHAVPGTRGFELLPGLPHPAAYDFFVWKGVEPDMHPYGACYHDLREQRSTGLIEYLTYQNISTVVIGGLSLDYCVKSAALQLKKAGFQTIVHLAATRGLHIETLGQAKIQMQAVGVVLIDRLLELPNWVRD
jgi:nicotinamidase/pyrazinamidase